MAGLMVLALILSTSAIATGVVFGVFAGVVTGLAFATIRRELGPPRQAVTHNHYHDHRQVVIMRPAEPPAQVEQPERQLTIR